MKLIDLDDLLKFPIRMENYDTENGNEHFVLGIESVLEYAEHLPTVDAVPVVYGEWLPTNAENKKRCSRCDVIHLIAQYPAVGANLCPACGAKMEGGNEE